MRRFRLILSVIIVCVNTCIAQLNSDKSELIEKFTTMLSRDLQRDNKHGCLSVLVMKNDHIIFQKAIGYKRASEDAMADSATIYCIGSITKTFTATLLLQLVEQGKIKLDNPVETYIPEIKSLKGYTASQAITFRHLASHISGLAREGGFGGGRSGPVEEWENKLIASIPQTGIENPPGKKFQYSNFGYALLGLAIERAAGIPFMELVRQNILNPLKMDNSFFSVPEGKLGNLADGILNSDEFKVEKMPKAPTLQNIGYTGPGYGVPSGGLNTTIGDLSKFINALRFQKTLMTEISFKEMQTVQPGADKYGLGLMIYDGEASSIGHSGATPGYVTNFRVDQKSGYTVIVMRNYKGGKTNLEYESWKLLSNLSKD